MLTAGADASMAVCCLRDGDTLRGRLCDGDSLAVICFRGCGGDAAQVRLRNGDKDVLEGGDLRRLLLLVPWCGSSAVGAGVALCWAVAAV